MFWTIEKYIPSNGFEQLREEHTDFESGTVCFEDASQMYHQLIF